jgi:YVTN family beta-propeller protein
MMKMIVCRVSLPLRQIFLAWIILWAAGGSVSAFSTAEPGITTFKHSSSAIAITPDGATLLAVNPDSNSVTLVDAAGQSVIAEIGVGVDPRSVAVSAGGDVAYVANQGSDSLSIIDIPALAVTATLLVGDRPVSVATSPDGSYVAVAELGDDRVSLLDASDLSTHAFISVADRPYGLAFTPDSAQLLITHLLSGVVTVSYINPYRIYLPLVHNVSQVYPPIFSQSSASGTISQHNLLISISTWPNVAPAPAVLVNATGARAYLPQTMANGLGLNTRFDNTVFPKVSVLNLATQAHQTSEHISLPETDRPVGLPWDAALAKGDTELWVVNSASNDVSVINISQPTHPVRVANIPVGDNPRGIVLAPDGDFAYVNNILAGTVSVIDANTYTVTQVITTTVLPLPPALLNGKRLFFSSATLELARARWISCNNCHVEGEHDGRTWLLQYLGEVPPGEDSMIRRNTTSLLGMIETYPLRWSAEWNESADSEFSIRFEQYGSGLIEGEMHPTLGDPNQGRSYSLDCLALYIDSLSVPPRSHTFTAAELRGKAIFESPQTQCVTCHPAPLYTDLQVHDVGTADGSGEWFGPIIDTPTLRFLYDSPPYLHDGSAADLYEVLVTKNPGDEHGVTSDLGAQEIEDLIAFLLALP